MLKQASKSFITCVMIAINHGTNGTVWCPGTIMRSTVLCIRRIGALDGERGSPGHRSATQDLSAGVLKDGEDVGNAHKINGTQRFQPAPKR